MQLLTSAPTACFFARKIWGPQECLHFAIEIKGTPEGVVGKATHATAQKAKRPLVAILRYLTLVQDEILAAFPSGKLPPVSRPRSATRRSWPPTSRSR